MDVVVAGGHGKIGLRLLRLLAARGDRARGLIRKPEQADDLEREDDISQHVSGANAVVFAAGAGPGSGPERKRTMDLGGALKLIDAAKATGVSRYLIVSSMGAGNPSSGSQQMRPYLEAKHDADEALAASGLDYTIVRPGGLTDEPGSGRIALAESLGRRGSIPRDDVAAVLALTLTADNTIGRSFELLGGDTPIEEAVRSL